MEDRKVITCNFKVATKVARRGALAFVFYPHYGGGCTRVRLLVRSRGGRWVDKWEDVRRLSNFRSKTIPAEHPLYERFPYAETPTEAMLLRLNQVSETT